MKLYAFLSLVSFSIAAIKRHQNITVIGKATCHGIPLEDITIELKEKDYFSKDDVLMTSQTDNNGTFLLFGEDNEVLNISPIVIFHHNCTQIPGCQRQTVFDVPSEWIGGIYKLNIDLSKHEEGDKSKC